MRDTLKVSIATVASVVFAAAACGAEAPASVLGQCRQVFGDLRPHVTLERKEGDWQVSHVFFGHYNPSDIDLRKLAGLATVESVFIFPGWSGSGSITADGIRSLGALKHLRQLGVMLNLPEGVLKSVGSLRGLEELDLEYCEGIKDADLVFLRDLPKLRRLKLNHAGLTNGALAFLRPLRNLEELELGSNYITDAGVAQLEGMGNLRSFKCDGLTAASLAAMKGLPRLEELVLHGRPADLSSWGSLRSVDMDDLGNSAESGIRLPQNLERLSLSISRKGEAPGLQRLPRHLRSITIRIELSPDASVDLKWLSLLPDLVELDLENATDNVVSEISGLKSVRTLTLHQSICVVPLGDDSMKRIGEMRRLESLEITQSSLTNAGMRQLRNLTELRVLKLSGLKEVSDRGFACLREMKSLRALTLADLSVPADDIIAQLQGLDALEELSINGARLTDTGLKKLADLKKLRCLDLTYTHGYTDVALAALMQALPDLHTVRRSYEPR